MYGAESGVSGLGRRVEKIVIVQRGSSTNMYKGVQNIQRRIDRKVVVVKLKKNIAAEDGSNGGHFPEGVSALGLVQALCRCNAQSSPYLSLGWIR